MNSETLVGLSRGWRFLLGIAFALLFWVLVGASFLPLALRVSGVWLVLLFGAGMVLRVDSLWKDVGTLVVVGSLLLVSCGWDLLILFLVQFLGGGLQLGLVILSLSLPVLALSPWLRGFSRPKLSRGQGLLLLALAAAIFIHLVRQPAQLRLDSDVPAHLGAVHDALQQDRFLPHDGSFPGAPDARDPRMGVLHGLHAALAKVLLADPARVWALSGGMLSLMFLACFGWLFLEWGLPGGLALVAAFLVAAGAGGGSALGLWGAVYPAQFALALAAASGAWYLRASREGAEKGQWWLGCIALGLSVLVHPFAWWGMCLVLGHLLILSWFVRRPRKERLATLRYLVVAGVLGIALLLPLLLEESGTAGQWQRAGVLLLGRKFFVMDPLVVLRWSGILAPLAILLALWRWRRFAGSLSGLFVVASVLPLWTITFDPLLQPFVFAHCGYLSERLGLLAAGPAVLLLAMLPADYKGSWSLFRRVFVGAIALGLMVWVWPQIRTSPYRSGALPAPELVDAAAALEANGGVILADPRTSYALRGLNGGSYTLLPVAHASPLDASIERRTGSYRAILARECSPQQFESLGEGLGASALLLMDRVEAEYRGAREYGFVASNLRQKELGARLKEAGSSARAQGSGWTLFDFEDLAIAPRIALPDTTECAGFTRAKERQGTPLKLRRLAVTPSRASPGDSLTLELCYTDASPSLRDQDWSELELRFLGPEQAVPELLRGVSKLYRKLIQERSLRSRSRFTVRTFPNEGYPRSEEEWGESLRVRIPEWIRPGRYEVHAKLQRKAWRPVRRIADYLDDRARWSGESLGHVIVEQEEGMRR